MKRALLAIAAALLAAAPAEAAKPFTVGNGENPGVALDDSGTAYVAWQVNLGDPGDAVQVCVVPVRARQCASSVTVPFPGDGYARSRASVLLPAPNVVEVVVPRVTGIDDRTYLARSTDGGRSFGPAAQISGEGFEQAVPGPGGRVALVGGPVLLNADLAGLDGSEAGSGGAELGDFLEGQFNDIATQGAEVVAASSDAADTSAFRLPAGAEDDDAAAWQALPPLPAARQPELAGGPAGLAVMLEPSRGRSDLFVRRLEGAAWSPPVSTGFGVLNNDFELSQNGRGRLTGIRTEGIPYRLEYASSTDGGVLWSSAVTVARYGDPYPADLEMATAARGRGAAVIASSLDDEAIRVVRLSPRMSPVARGRFGRARVQARSKCGDDAKLRVVVEAARGNRRLAPARVLRRARFGRARGARRRAVGRFRARYVLRRRATRVRVRVVPRRGRARTLVLPVRRCYAP